MRSASMVLSVVFVEEGDWSANRRVLPGGYMLSMDRG